MTREQLIEAAKVKAQVMGWVVLDQVDMTSKVEFLLGAEGAAEQVVCAPLNTLRRELSDLGGPENYPAIEEYDVLVGQDGSWTEEAERLASPGGLPAGEDSPDIAGPQEEAKEAVEMSAGLKELWRAMTGQVDDQDRGGIPRPKAKKLGLHEDPESAYHRPIEEDKVTKTVVRASSVFRVQGLNLKARTLESSAFSSGKYRNRAKAQRGARGAKAAGLLEVRVARLPA